MCWCGVENRYKVKTLTVAIDFSDGGAIYDTIRRALADLEIGVLGACPILSLYISWVCSLGVGLGQQVTANYIVEV